jgi:uncharacterized membrane protein
VAFVRTARLREALALAEARLRALEETIEALRADGSVLVPPPAATPAPAEAQAFRAEPAEPPIAARASEPEALPARPTWAARWERTLASNWLVWIGGVFIVLAVVFILRFAIDEGWFGPPAQLASAYLLGAALLAGAEWTQRRSFAALADTQLRRLPTILAAAGLFAVFAATFAGYANFALLDVRAAFVLMALSALLAILLSLRFGAWLAALGLGGGYVAPALVRFDQPSPPALFGYVLALTAAALTVIRLRQWRGFVWLAGGGAVVWGAAWLASPMGASSHGAGAFYLVALTALGLGFAWREAETPLSSGRDGRLLPRWRESMLAAHVLAAAAALVLLLILWFGPYSPAVVTAIVAFCALTAIAASAGEGFVLIALGAAGLGVAMLWLWPSPTATAANGAIVMLIRAAGALGFVFSAGGWLMMARNRRAGFGAALAALGPILVIVATHHAAGYLRGPLVWSGAALMLAAINTFALERMARRLGGLDRAPGASAAFALGAACASVFAIYFALERQGLWLSMALALMAPVMARIDVRFRLPALRLAISLLGAVVLWRMLLVTQPVDHPISRTPLFNEILPTYAIAAISFWSAAWLYRSAAVTTRIIAALEVAALVLAAAGVSLEVRHIATGGDLQASSVSLGEMGGYALAWLGFALSLAARFGARPRPVIFFAELTAAGAAALLVLVFGGLVLNPWWGDAPSAAPGWPILNVLLVAFGLPAALLGAYAILKRRQGFAERAAIAGAAAVVFVFLNVTLEVRRLFHPFDMAAAAMRPLEAWAYTAVWVAFAGALLSLGLMRRKPSLRYASLAVLLAAIIKAFGFDMSALTGVLRALSYLGLGAAIIAVALVYQRFVFPRGLAGKPDANLIPPR